MRNWDSSDEAGQETCPADEDQASAQEVAAHIGVPLRVASFERQYWTEVFEPFLARYELGLTPNPDVDCNRSVKFGHLLRHCLGELGAHGIATGHYCTVAHPGTQEHARMCAAVPATQQMDARDSSLLLRGVDPVKDQSYFLSGVPAGALAHVSTPLGALTKPQVRAMARQAALPNAERRDSYGICFVGKRKLPQWLPQYLPLTRGRFVCVASGAQVGDTDGIELWTEGQGARLGGMAHRYTVVGKSLPRGQVLVAPPSHPACLSTGLIIPLTHLNAQVPPEWLLGPLQQGCPQHVLVRIRHRQEQLVPAIVQLKDAQHLRESYPASWLKALSSSSAAFGEGGGAAMPTEAGLHVQVTFQAPQPFVSPGQIAALYHTHLPVCLGGGPIVARGVGEEAAHGLMGACEGVYAS